MSLVFHGRTPPLTEEQQAILDRRMADAGARAVSQRSVSIAGDPGPDSDRPYDHHHPNCYCRRCLAEKRSDR